MLWCVAALSTSSSNLTCILHKNICPFHTKPAVSSKRFKFCGDSRLLKLSLYFENHDKTNNLMWQRLFVYVTAITWVFLASGISEQNLLSCLRHIWTKSNTVPFVCGMHILDFNDPLNAKIDKHHCNKAVVNI